MCMCLHVHVQTHGRVRMCWGGRYVSDGGVEYSTILTNYYRTGGRAPRVRPVRLERLARRGGAFWAGWQGWVRRKRSAVIHGRVAAGGQSGGEPLARCRGGRRLRGRRPLVGRIQAHGERAAWGLRLKQGPRVLALRATDVFLFTVGCCAGAV